MSSNRHIFSVSELNAQVRQLIESGLGLIWLEAEISNLAKPASGHLYFTLKDQQSQVRCAFFRNRNRLLNFNIEEGQQIRVRARVSLYEARGDYQLIVEHMELAGEGDLQRAFEQLKLRLQKEGLFDEEHKQLLPDFPQCIGVITSASGAALQDILHVHARRYPAASIIIYPTAVQGDTAAAQIKAMIDTAASRQECDVLILARGGGSLEDLWAFNHEELARAIYDCPIPVVSGVGHETDFSIADFVADVRAPTPSAAIEIVTPDKDELKKSLHQYTQSLYEQISRKLQNCAQQKDWQEQRLNRLHPKTQLGNYREQLKMLYARLTQQTSQQLRQEKSQLQYFSTRLAVQSPAKYIHQQQQNLLATRHQLTHSMQQKLATLEQRLADSSRQLDLISPLQVLARGYSITYLAANEQSPIRNVNEIQVNDMIETRLYNGNIQSRVEKVNAKN